MKASQNFDAYFYYDESSPSCLRWKVERRSGRGLGRIMVRADDVAGTAKNKRGYAVVGLHGVTFLIHKIIWQLKAGVNYGEVQIDHEDGDESNNRFGNLREASQQLNMRNRRISSANTSGATGVSQARIRKQTYWRARWYTLDGREQTKLFNVEKLGDAEAFTQAWQHRKAMIKQLNSAGAGYKERHGV